MRSARTVDSFRGVRVGAPVPKGFGLRSRQAADGRAERDAKWQSRIATERGRRNAVRRNTVRRDDGMTIADPMVVGTRSVEATRRIGAHAHECQPVLLPQDFGA